MKSNNVAQTNRAKADAHFAMRLPSQTLALLSRAASADGRSTSAMAVRMIQTGLAAMVSRGELAV